MSDISRKVLEVVKALEGHDVAFLKKISERLKGDFGGEGWAIGEMVERTVTLYGESGTIRLREENSDVGKI